MSFLSDPSLWGLSLLSASSKASFLRRWQLCPKCWWGCGVTETLRGWNAKWHSYTGKQLSSFLKSLSYVSHMIHPPHSWVFTQEKWNQLSTQSLEQGCSQQPYSHQPKKVEWTKCLSKWMDTYTGTSVQWTSPEWQKGISHRDPLHYGWISNNSAEWKKTKKSIW